MSAPATARSGASNTATRTSLPVTYSTGVTARERPPLPRLGNGYEPPGKLDCFADGTPALGEPLPEQWTETIKKKKKKARNPRKKMPPEVMDLFMRN